MHPKTALPFILLMLFTVVWFQINDAVAQNDTEATFIARAQVRPQDTSSFLIENGKLYEFEIRFIEKIKNGYMISLGTTINGKPVYCDLISPKNKCVDGETLKIGKKYIFPIYKYNLIPAVVATESVLVMDVLLGEKTMYVNEDGSYYYLFYSPWIGGTSIMDATQIGTNCQHFTIDSLDISTFVKKFVCMITDTFSEVQLYSISDIKALKKNILQHGIYIQGRAPQDLLSRNEKCKWRMSRTPDRLYTDMKKRRESLYSLFSQMLKQAYNLPFPSRNSSIRIRDIHCLYFTAPDIYTISVIFDNESIKKRYLLILNIQKQGEKFVLIGFNKAYLGYRLYVEKDNYPFLPLPTYSK